MIAAFIIQFLGFGCLLAAALVKLYRVAVELSEVQAWLEESRERYREVLIEHRAVCNDITWGRAARIIRESKAANVDADEVLLEERV